MVTRERFEIFLLVTLWSLFPMWSAIVHGEIAGSPYTDLYPSVWSLWATESWWGSWKNIWFRYPDGQPWSPSTLFWGTLIIPLKPFISIGTLYNVALLINRVLTCCSFYMAGRIHKDNHGTGLLWMVILAMNPMVHGFAVEGILEGTQLWPLGFWFWSMKKKFTMVEYILWMLNPVIQLVLEHLMDPISTDCQTN